MAYRRLELTDFVDLGNGKVITVKQILAKIARLEKRAKAEENRYHMTSEDALIVSRC